MAFIFGYLEADSCWSLASEIGSVAGLHLQLDKSGKTNELHFPVGVICFFT